MFGYMLLPRAMLSVSRRAFHCVSRGTDLDFQTKDLCFTWNTLRFYLNIVVSRGTKDFMVQISVSRGTEDDFWHLPVFHVKHSRVLASSVPSRKQPHVVFNTFQHFQQLSAGLQAAIGRFLTLSCVKMVLKRLLQPL